MPEDVSLWVRKHKPKTSEEAAAEDFIQAGRPLTQTTTRAPRGERPLPPGKCPRCGGEGQWVSDCPRARAGGPPLPREHAAKPERESAPSRCFHCQQRGHFAANCPNNAALYCEGEDRSSVDVSAPHPFPSQTSCLYPSSSPHLPARLTTATVPPLQELAPVTTALFLLYLFIYLELVAYLTGSMPKCESCDRLNCSGLVESAQINEVPIYIHYYDAYLLFAYIQM